jgi:hypothetical protein
VGINGTGKTTFINDSIIKNYSAKSLVVTPDSMEWRHLPIIPPDQIRTFTGAGRIIYENIGTIEEIAKNYHGGNLIFDDAMAYLSNQTPEIMRYIYIRRRQYGIDIYIVAHGLRQLPPQVFTFASYIILFNSTENFTYRKRELQPELFDKISAAQQRIAKKVSEGNPYYKEIILLDPQIKAINGKIDK